MKKFIAGSFMLIVLLAIIALIFKPFIEFVIKDGWRGVLIGTLTYLFIGLVIWLIIKVLNWCVKVLES